MDRRFSAVTAINDLDNFAALDPFFRIIEEGLSALAEEGHFFDLLADDVVFDYVITVPGYPRQVVGRSAVAELYRPYGSTFVLYRCFDLAVHHDREAGVVVLEYASEGRVVATGLPMQTGTSRYSRSSTARSPDGATTLTRSQSSTPADGPNADQGDHDKAPVTKVGITVPTLAVRGRKRLRP